jgi:hypothetical protein
MRPRSSTLFHFTKSEDILFDILEYGFWPRYCLEDIQWQNIGIDFVAFPMVCFCDIPLARISEHVGFYGSYGIGLSRSWAEKNNLNPLLYVSSGSGLNRAINNIFARTLELSTKDDNPADDARFIVAHSKPTTGQIIIDGKGVEKEFYQESEWRYVPSHEEIANYIVRDFHEDATYLEEQHTRTKKFASLKFLPSDVAYIFVPRDSDIPNVINFIQSRLDHYPNADLKVLFSRVTSLESIKRDM